MDTKIIDSREDFAQWAIERANAILTDQASDLATAARNGNEAQIDKTARALGQAIDDAMLDTFDGLAGDV
jgi:hypothetical protein